ncbi:MAG: hypothetical protein JWO35_839 [Candidatus Saccharibacteria bacterium]|nr:hypothetical protein [Candidatus Saccharibacteria bacterium]
MPAGITSKPATLHESVNYHSYDDAWVPDVLDGKTKAEVGDKYEPILSTEVAETLRTYAQYNAIAIEKVRDYKDLDKIVHLSYGDFSAHDYLQHIVSFRAFRIYDISKLIGVDATMPDDLVQGLWDEFTPVIEGYRQMGVFPPALEVPESADLQTKLLGLVGRD